MAICAVFGCKSNNTKKLKRNAGGISFKLFRFPRNERLAKIWLNRCKRKDNINLKTSYVCSKHFSKEQYARNLRHELLGYSPKCRRRLKDEAVPDDNLPERAEDFVFQAVSQVEVISDEITLEDGGTISEEEQPPLESLVIEYLEDADVEAGGLDKTAQADCGVPAPKETPKEPSEEQQDLLTQELEKLKREKIISEMSSQVEILTLKREIEMLKSEMDTLLEENSALKASNKSLSQENVELMEENNMLSRIFTPKQREKMRNSGKRLNWTMEDISRAVALYYNGPQAYNFLLRQGYPLPAMITLKKWLAKKRDSNAELQDEAASS